MLKVLHIEDDTDNRRLVRKLLVANGFEVVEASDALSGIRKALSSEPDIILLDIELPDMTGYEVTLKLRGEMGDRQVPIVALSGKGDRKMVEAVGFDGLIHKPIDVSRFCQMVTDYVRVQRRQRRSEDDSTLLMAQGQQIASRLQAKLVELEETNRALLASEKVRAEFYRNLSHELSTPLTPAVGYLNMLTNEELGPLTPLQRKALESVSRGVNKVRSMVENLLDMTALTTGQMHFFERRYDFNRIAKESVPLTMEKFRERGLSVETDIGPGEFIGHGAPDKLKRAMVQLLENAVKFCSGNGRTLVCTRRDGDRYNFLVYDSGKGIPDTELQSIFKTFYQIDGPPTREHGCTGIGLALSRKIIERVGCTIWAESPPLAESDKFKWAQTMVALWVPAQSVAVDVESAPPSPHSDVD